MTEHERGAGAQGPWDAGDEARRLVDAVQEWAQRAMPAPPDGHGGPECQWCPLCRVASVLRGEHPEFTERIAEAGSTVLAAFRALADPSVSRGASGTAETGNVPERSRVQRISLDDVEPTS